MWVERCGVGGRWGWELDDRFGVDAEVFEFFELGNNVSILMDREEVFRVEKVLGSRRTDLELGSLDRDIRLELCHHHSRRDQDLWNPGHVLLEPTYIFPSVSVWCECMVGVYGGSGGEVGVFVQNL